MTTATTAPTPDEVHALAARLEHCVAKWGKQNALSLEAYSAVKMLRRLLAKVERLESERITRIDQQTKLSLRIVDLQSEVDRLRAAADSPTTNQATNYSENYSAAWQINALTTRKVEAICAREPYAVTGVVLSQPDGRACIVNQSAVRWFHGERDFWSVMHPDSNPQPISYRCRIGLPCSKCQTGKYRAAGNGYYDFHRCDSCMHVPMWGADGNELGPAPLIARREVVSDGPVRVTRLHLSTEGRAALTTTATGPLPGIAGGAS